MANFKFTPLSQQVIFALIMFLDIMLSNVNDFTNRLIAKSTENTEKLAALDSSLGSNRVEEIFQRVNAIRPPIDALSNKNTLKIS